MSRGVVLIILIALVVIIVNQSFYTVDERQHAIVTRFGKIIDVKTMPGLGTKAPFIDSVNYLDSRLLRVDMIPSMLPDRDQQFLTIDAYTRYTIVDPRQFYEKLGSKLNASDRIGKIVSSVLREEVAKMTREEIIGGQLDQSTGRVTKLDTRQRLLDRVKFAARQSQESLGIEIMDVRIKRADFPEAVEQNIFTRMRSEREKLAKGFRSEGDKTVLEITSDVDAQRVIILAEAQKLSNITRGEGDALAIEMFAKAMQLNPDLSAKYDPSVLQDPEALEFYRFKRSLEAYAKFLGSNSTLVLSADSELFSFLQDPRPKTSR